MNVYYFGTDLANHGHYFWEIKPEVDYLISQSVISKKIPFDPENLFDDLLSYYNGYCRFLHIEAQEGFYGEIKYYTICAIVGSCKDSRPRSKSVFWVNSAISFEEIKQRILDSPVANNIISQMPFKISW